MSEPTIDERLAEARLAKAEREKKLEEVAKARELLVLDLEAKYDAELGQAGVHFEVLEFKQIDKVVAVKRAAPIVVKRFDDSAKKKTGQTVEDAMDYVLPNLLHPTKEEFKGWCSVHASLMWEAAGALRRMEGLRASEVAGKP